MIVLGAGGVGKTTIAAALGVACAQAGTETALITIDPARRLRDALGLHTLDGVPTRLNPDRLKRAGMDRELRLSAMVLDVKRQWDGLVEQFIPDPATRDRILANGFYRTLAGRFAGSDAYAALEQLYEIRASGRFDAAIVDTPPAAHAFEFIQAPGRLVQLLESGAARYLLASPAVPGAGLAFKIASRAARFVMRELEIFAGGKVLSSIADFFTSAAAATAALTDRFRKAEAMLRSPTVHFVIVTTAEPDRLAQVRELIEELHREKLAPVAIIVNRYLDEEAWREPAASRRSTPHLPLRSTPGGSANHNRELRAAVAYLNEYRERLRNDRARVKTFAEALAADMEVMAVPEIPGEVGDLNTLKRIGAYLVRGGIASDRGPERAHRRASGKTPRLKRK